MLRGFAVMTLVFVAAMLALPGVSQARELHWRSLDVTAELDADGRLHVREEHAMVFDGNWNGGERVFSVSGRQRIELEAIERQVDGQLRQLTKGDLDAVDEWDWVASKTLRWRSRLPDDPPFSEQGIVYVLTYSLSNILLVEGEGYVLDHDFAFSDREGNIEEFTLDLDLAPEWALTQSVDLSWSQSKIVPGLGFPVYIELEHSTAERLSGVLYPVDPAWRHGALAVSLVGILAMFYRFWRHEVGHGRFEPTDAPPGFDPGWIAEHIHSWQPEQVGALWDESVGAPEVAALIARWTAEGKVKSETLEPHGFWQRVNMRLTRVPRAGRFSGYEGRLADKLFFAGDSVTTKELRKHYRTKGFDPAGVIRRGIESVVKNRLGNERGPAKPSMLRTLALFAAGAVFFGIAVVPAPESTLSWGMITTLAWIPLFGVGFAGARRWRHHLEGLRARAFWILGPALGLALAYWWIPAWLPTTQVRYAGFAALACVALATASFFFNQAATRVSRRRLEQRRRLWTIRRWWKAELKSEAPRLRDDDLPYLIALELQSAVDSWSVRFGSRSSYTRVPGGFSTKGSTGSGSWTGGGGAFGGAGATGAWTTAVAGLAGGVAAASSGSGSSGGGGGSSSGGGGGGGW